MIINDDICAKKLNRGDDPKTKKVWGHPWNWFHKLKDWKKDKRKELKLKITSTPDHEAPMVISPNSSFHIISVFDRQGSIPRAIDQGKKTPSEPSEEESFDDNLPTVE